MKLEEFEISKKGKMGYKAGNRVFDPLADVRGLDYKKRNPGFLLAQE